MRTKSTLFVIMALSLGVLAGPGSGQEVNSDVKIPPPRELVTGVPAINGLVGGTDVLFTSGGQLFQGAAAQAALGRLSEGQTRDELGNFMASLLVRAGIVAFDGPRADLTSTEETSKNGSWPAWAGATPMALSVGRTRGDASSRDFNSRAVLGHVQR